MNTNPPYSPSFSPPISTIEFSDNKRPRPLVVAIVTGLFAGYIQLVLDIIGSIILVVVLLGLPCANLMSDDDITIFGYINGAGIMVLLPVATISSLIIGYLVAKTREKMGKGNQELLPPILLGAAISAILFTPTLLVAIDLLVNKVCMAYK